MNRKGQALVLFVLLLPLLFIFVMLILEVGLLLLDNNKLDNEIKYTIKHALRTNNIIEENIEDMLNENLGEDIAIEIKIATSSVRIKVDKKHKFLFLKKKHTISSKYHGYKSNDKIYIEKE